MIEVRLAQSNAEREEVYRLRYEIYVEEFGWRSHYADHARRRIEEPLDRFASLFVAYRGDRFIGSLRTNYARNGGLESCADLYALRDFGDLYPERLSITNKLVIRREWRGSPAAFRLARACYQKGVADGILVDVIYCDPDKETFYTKLGYQVHRPCVVHPEFGPDGSGVCMKLFVGQSKQEESCRDGLLGSVGLPDLVDVNDVAHAAVPGMNGIHGLPSFDGKLVGNHARSGFEVLL